jgi:hypothetical protein
VLRAPSATTSPSRGNSPRVKVRPDVAIIAVHQTANSMVRQTDATTAKALEYLAAWLSLPGNTPPGVVMPSRRCPSRRSRSSWTRWNPCPATTSPDHRVRACDAAAGVAQRVARAEEQSLTAAGGRASRRHCCSRPGSWPACSGRTRPHPDGVGSRLHRPIRELSLIRQRL